MTPWLLLLASYLLGSIPASYIGGRLARGIDLREHGSGNLGATNAFRVLGAKIAAPVMTVDLLKGFLPVWGFPRLAALPDGPGWPLAFGAAAVLGHVFSVFMSFRGGKGVATAAGVFLALAPLAVGVAFSVWLVTLLVARMVSLASVLAAVTMVLLLLTGGASREVRLVGVVLAGFVVFTHRANLGRILRGEEHRFGKPRAERKVAETVVAAAAGADPEREP
ncbi:MAG: glycerol-3-phosphate 1-O-acyltransferase PlsY [Gemmatimonadota bacterium]|nr:glycerol-3-phosphate 1-O-acyltransferase PlsY [Gemmatimonadota bacterium]